MAGDARPPDRPPPARPLYNSNNGQSGFVGGAALRGYSQDSQAYGPGPGRGQLPQSHLSRSKPPPPPINTSFIPSRPPPVPTMQQRQALSYGGPAEPPPPAAASKRPAGTRLASEPPSLPGPHSATDGTKAKKGLPFLRNPVSTLLNRRKVNEELPVPTLGKQEPVYAPIRGTRIHDFSAPRPRRHPSNDAAVNKTSEPATRDAVVSKEAHGLAQYPAGDATRDVRRGSGAGVVPFADPEAREPVGLDNFQHGQGREGRRRPSFDHKPLPEQPIPPVPPKDTAVSPVGSNSTKSRSVSIDTPVSLPKSTPSTLSSRSRNISVSERSIRDGVISAVPRHMKSTSSRFSFMVGSANEEKLLEERHRQKLLEKETTSPGPAGRDSRFDDFNEDDFDYDAMMEDDGFEERIPGVNVDAEEDDFMAEDPDNDQENFSGFVFQRSNPASTLPTPISPGMVATPRDAHGNVIGFAMSQNTPLEDLQEHPSTPPVIIADTSMEPKLADDVSAGLGIHGVDVSAAEAHNIQAFRENRGLPAASRADDDLYFDQGLADELDFGEPESGAAPFDESIFDNNDTDEYGRPIPGAFAQAQAIRAAMAEGPGKRESDVTSRLSGQSQMSQSTAHTSLSVGVQNVRPLAQKHGDGPQSEEPPEEPTLKATQFSEQEQIAAYQAALAEAAHKAAASGKFRRDSSPAPVPDPGSLSLESAADPSGNHDQEAHGTPLDDFDDDGGFTTQDMDDYDFDDDAIIAEANASALANDMDGFYGQEFGFFAAPTQAHGHGHGHSGSSKSSGSAPLNAQNLYEYSSGGYFGPSGGARPIVSREPNLTPITERSEYSNRNSIMSLGLPPMGGSGEMRSPGLAQLAMMADDGDMTLQALMRLRNRTFGGSQVSLAASSREGSPMSAAAADKDGSGSPWALQSGYLNIRDAGQPRKNSAFSIRSKDSEPGSGSASPTLTMGFPIVSPSPIPPPLFSPPMPPNPSLSQPQPSPAVMGGGCPPVLEDEETPEDEAGATGGSSMSGSAVWMRSPAEPSHSNITSPSLPPSAHARRPGMGHRHKGSADSISYMQEKGEDSETRWVMERRRTAETGEVEILGRQVVEGGRI